MSAAGHQKHVISVEELNKLYWIEHLSQTEIAKRTGIPQVTIGRYLRKHDLSDPNRRREQHGVLNHNFKDGMSRSTLRRKTLEVCEGRDLRTCERCHTTWSQNLDRHHKDRDRRNNSSSNIEIICPSCHAKEHDRERARQNGMYA